jgi:hypothetical protein
MSFSRLQGMEKQSRKLNSWSHALSPPALDRAAYAAVDPEGHWSEDWAAVWLDTGAGQKPPADHPLAEERARVDQAVLGNLLRMNGSRATGWAR